MKTLSTIIVAAFALSACPTIDTKEEASACDEYVDALCRCNPDHCEAFTTTYRNADSVLQDVCSEKIADAEAGDDESCETGDETGTAMR